MEAPREKANGATDVSGARCPGCQREAEVNRPRSGSLTTSPWQEAVSEAIGVDPPVLDLVPEDCDACDASENGQRRVWTLTRGRSGLTGDVRC